MKLLRFLRKDSLKMGKKITIVVIIIIGGFLGYNYLFQEHRIIAEETADYITNSNKIISEFQVNPSAAEETYLNKTLSITGKITDIKENNIILNQKIYCQMLVSSHEWNINDSVTIKGRCIGYDNLLGEIKMDQCSIQINK